VLTVGSYGRYVSPGFIVYARKGALLAVPFSLARLELAGSPFPLQENVLMMAESGAAQFAISEPGTLACVSGGELQMGTNLLWVDRRGSVQPLAETREYGSYSISPDGRRLALEALEGSNYQVFAYDIQAGRFTRLTFEGINLSPVWTPDGKRIAFRSSRNGSQNIFWMPADGSGSAEQLTTGAYTQVPYSWSPDGQLLAYVENRPDTKQDIWLFHLNGRTADPFLRTIYDESSPNFSRDGRWLAYLSNESGTYEVYVQGLQGGKWQISNGGGVMPIWAHNGYEMYYRNGNSMMAVDFRSSPTFSAGTPKILFRIQHRESATLVPDFDVSADDQRFLMEEDKGQTTTSQINITLHWFEELKRLVPAGKK
jgi:dipeptidyl aminopeptidase/acylaminoacyl peptidase